MFVKKTDPPFFVTSVDCIASIAIVERIDMRLRVRDRIQDACMHPRWRKKCLGTAFRSGKMWMYTYVAYREDVVVQRR